MLPHKCKRGYNYGRQRTKISDDENRSAINRCTSNEPKAVEPTAIPIMFADDTSILINSPNTVQLQSDLNSGMGQLNEWFQENLITLNLEKNTLYSIHK